MEPVWATEQRGNERVFKYQFRPLKRQKNIFYPNLFGVPRILIFELRLRIPQRKLNIYSSVVQGLDGFEKMHF